MSLYEILSMTRALEKDQKGKKGRQVSDEEWEQAENLLASVVQHDPSVMIH